MYEYLFLVIGAALLINIATLVFYGNNVRQYEFVMEQVLDLNQFYVKLEDCNQILGRYMQEGQEIDYQEIQETIGTADDYLEALEQNTISGVFVRDVQDMRQMLKSYGAQTDTIHQIILNSERKFTSGVLGSVLECYDAAQESYDLMDGEFKNLHLTLLEYMNQKMAVLIRQKRIYYAEFLVVVIFVVCWSILRGRRLAEQIAEPIQSLTEAAVQIRDGRMSEFSAVETRNIPGEEIQILVHVFNMMIDQIREQFRLTEENARAKAKMHEQELENLKITSQLHASELKVLQMQMNPHFLFNTLNMIAKTAYLGDSEETVFLLQKTAELLRYSLDYMGKSVTLARELEILDCYVCLQEKRFGTRIDFDFDLDERFHQLQIPCLILQPLVENAITHGVGTYTEGGRILIQTRWLEEEQKGRISVWDNGLGLGPEELEQVRREMKGGWNDQEKIGLGNVYMRLTKFFGEAVEMEVYSTLRKGTEIRILLPLERKEETICTVC